MGATPRFVKYETLITHLRHNQAHLVIFGAVRGQKSKQSHFWLDFMDPDFSGAWPGGRLTPRTQPLNPPDPQKGLKCLLKLLGGILAKLK